MTVMSRGGDVVRLDIRDTDDATALGRLEHLLLNPPDDLLGVVVVDTVGGLRKHQSFFERLGGSRQIESALVVAIGGLAINAPLTVPASLRRDRGPTVIWVADPVGSKWQVGAAHAARLTKPTPEKALARLLAVLEVPEIYQEVATLPSTPAASPGLSLLGDGDDENQLLHALNRALNRLQRGRDEPGRAMDDVRQAVNELQAVVAPPGAQPELLTGGRLERTSTDVRAAIAQLTAEVQGLSRPSSLMSGSRALRRARLACARTADALVAQREACAALPDGVHAPGGGILPGAINRRCGEFGLRLRPIGPSSTSAGQIVGDQVTSWIARDVSLTNVDTRLQQLERELVPGTPEDYRAQLWQDCPDSLVSRCRNLPAFPSTSPGVVLAALATGLLAGFAGTGSVLATVATLTAAVLLWAWPLAVWPAAEAQRVVLPLLCAGSVVGAGSLGYLGAKAWQPPPGMAAFSAVAALVLTVGTLWTTWRQACSDWSDLVRIDDVETAHTQMQSGLNRLVVSQWAAAEPRSEAINTVILARSMTAGLRSAAAPVAAELEPKVRATRMTEQQRGDYWNTVVGTQLRSVTIAAMRPLWDGLTDHRPDSLQQEVHGELDRALRGWIDGSGDPLLRVPQLTRGDAPSSRLTADAVQDILTAVTVDADSTMWQLIAPDDLSRLSPKTRDLGVVRFAPAHLEELDTGRLRHRVVPLVGSAAAGLLRLVPLKPGIVEHRYAISLDLRDDSPRSDQTTSPQSQVSISDSTLALDPADDETDLGLPKDPGDHA